MDERALRPPPGMRAWSFVLAFGTVSLLADFVYEGARSITGPLLASLGATGLLVGVVTGAGEAAALVLRLVSGPLADRTRRFWAFTIGGYALTLATVPFLGLTGVLWVVCALVIAERVGKAVRSPAKDTMLSHATAVTGRGKGFAVHEAMDQFGAVIGPLTVAGMLALTGGQYGPSLAVLAIPGAAALGMLAWLRTRVPHPLDYETPPPPSAARKEAAGGPPRRRLPQAFWMYAAFTAMTMAGFATFGVLSFHLVEHHVLPPSAVPLLYAAVMGIDAVTALATGWMYDRFGPRSLSALPLLAATVPVLAFTDSVPLAVTGALVWGAALGIQESTLRATVADLVPPARRATAYGIFAAVTGVATLIGGTLAGALYDVSIAALVIVTAVVQAAALVLLVRASRHGSPGGPSARPGPPGPP